MKDILKILIGFLAFASVIFAFVTNALPSIASLLGEFVARISEYVSWPAPLVDLFALLPSEFVIAFIPLFVIPLVAVIFARMFS